MSKEHIGNYLDKQLKRKGISQTELVKLLGVTRQTINKHINDGSRFDLSNYIKLAEILDLTVDDLVFGGEGRPTELKRFAQIQIDRIDVTKVPEQPDGLGNTLLDYVIKMNSVPKFKLFFKNDCFVEALHNHIDLICFLIKNEQVDLLKRKFPFERHDQITKHRNIHGTSIEFPPLNFKLENDGKIHERNNHPYSSLNIYQKKIVDTILNTKSTEILDLIPYRAKPGINTLPSLYYWSIYFDKVFIYKYYIDKYNYTFYHYLYNLYMNHYQLH